MLSCTENNNTYKYLVKISNYFNSFLAIYRCSVIFFKLYKLITIQLEIDKSFCFVVNNRNVNRSFSTSFPAYVKKVYFNL